MGGIAMTISPNDKIKLISGKSGRYYAIKSSIPNNNDKSLLIQNKDGQYISHKSGIPIAGQKILLTQGKSGVDYGICGGEPDGNFCEFIWTNSDGSHTYLHVYIEPSGFIYCVADLIREMGINEIVTDIIAEEWPGTIDFTLSGFSLRKYQKYQRFGCIFFSKLNRFLLNFKLGIIPLPFYQFTQTDEGGQELIIADENIYLNYKFNVWGDYVTQSRYFHQYILGNVLDVTYRDFQSDRYGNIWLVNYGQVDIYNFTASPITMIRGQRYPGAYTPIDSRGNGYEYASIRFSHPLFTMELQDASRFPNRGIFLLYPDNYVKDGLNHDAQPWIGLYEDKLGDSLIRTYLSAPGIDICPSYWFENIMSYDPGTGLWYPDSIVHWNVPIHTSSSGSLIKLLYKDVSISKSVLWIYTKFGGYDHKGFPGYLIAIGIYAPFTVEEQRRAKKVLFSYKWYGKWTGLSPEYNNVIYQYFSDCLYNEEHGYLACNVYGVTSTGSTGNWPHYLRETSLNYYTGFQSISREDLQLHVCLIYDDPEPEYTSIRFYKDRNFCYYEHALLPDSHNPDHTIRCVCSTGTTTYFLTVDDLYEETCLYSIRLNDGFYSYDEMGSFDFDLEHFATHIEGIDNIKHINTNSTSCYKLCINSITLSPIIYSGTNKIYEFIEDDRTSIEVVDFKYINSYSCMDLEDVFFFVPEIITKKPLTLEDEPHMVHVYTLYWIKPGNAVYSIQLQGGYYPRCYIYHTFSSNEERDQFYLENPIHRILDKDTVNYLIRVGDEIQMYIFSNGTWFTIPNKVHLLHSAEQIAVWIRDVKPEHCFETIEERDYYFLTNPSELIEGVLIKIGDEIYEWTDDGIWMLSEESVILTVRYCVNYTTSYMYSPTCRIKRITIPIKSFQKIT